MKEKTNKVIKLNFRLDNKSKIRKESKSNKSTVINLRDKQLSKKIDEMASLNRKDEDLLEG